MNRDWLIPVFLGAFPVVLTVALVIVFAMLQKVATVVCPKCGRRMPKSKGGIAAECQHCRQEADEATPARTTGVGNCAKCGRRDESGGLVRLWDGRDYCRNCLFTASPELTHFATTHSVLWDGAPWPLWRVWLQNFAIFEL